MTSKKRAPLESTIENKSCEHAESLGYVHIKLDLAKRKWPDRLFLGPDSQIFIVEFKRKGEVPRSQQERFHRRLTRMGHYVHVIDTVEDFKRLLG